MARFLVVLDVDSTLIENEVIELLAEEAGSLDRVSEITFRAMNGEIDFEASLRERVATLEGLPQSVFENIGSRIEVTRGVPEMIAGVQAAGGLVAVVSGGFHEIVDPIAEALGLDRWRANRLEVVDGRLTGGLIPPIVDAAAKSYALVGTRSVPSARVTSSASSGWARPEKTMRFFWFALMMPVTSSPPTRRRPRRGGPAGG